MALSSYKLAAFGLICAAAIAAPAFAQPPAAAPAASVAVASPTYKSIHMELMVNKSAADTWKRVGQFCDLGEWMRISCTISSGADGQFGAVRSIAGGRVTEVLVGETALSYTYTQPVAAGRPYNLYHGTLEAVPVSATTSKLVYTLFFDNSMLADDAARDRDVAAKTTQFTTALTSMKTLAEGGTLPPAPAAPARAGAPAAAPAAAGR
jgi:hypothetical protein